MLRMTSMTRSFTRVQKLANAWSDASRPCRRWGARTAPPPSLWLLAPVAAFCAAATFVAVYWPRRIQPDGGRGSLEGAGAFLLMMPIQL